MRRLRDVPPRTSAASCSTTGWKMGRARRGQLAGNVEHHDADRRAPAGVEDDTDLYDDEDGDEDDAPLPPAGMGLTRQDAEAYNRLAANREFYAGYDEADVLYHPDVHPADGLLLVPTATTSGAGWLTPTPGATRHLAAGIRQAGPPAAVRRRGADCERL
ncbi:MAG: hypothetical protein U0797_26355 [Gemmataceae bacterium]